MPDRPTGPIFIAVGGGKGGVGKSFVASNLALALARDRPGSKVVAVDLDLSGSNLNLFLGEPFPASEVADFLDGRKASLEAVAQPTRVANLRYVPGSFDLVTAVDPLRDRKLDLVAELIGLDADVVVLDLPAGAHPATLDFFFMGDVKVVVTNPESTAFANAYGFLKNYLLRRILTEFRDRQDVLGFVLDWFREKGPAENDRTLSTLIDRLRDRFPEAVPEVVGILEDDAPHLVLNRVRSREERRFLQRFIVVLRKNLDLRCPALGPIPEDRKVGRAARDGRPFLLEHPRHSISKTFEAWATRLVDGAA